jgi:Fe-S cluster assembly ATP-binding protein
VRASKGQEELDAIEFMTLARERMTQLGVDEALLNRPVNEGFSGGEKKRNEILQMAVLEPRLAILDETDSGLDIDALKIVANGVNAMRRAEQAFQQVTHEQHLLNYVVPTWCTSWRTGESSAPGQGACARAGRERVRLARGSSGR